MRMTLSDFEKGIEFYQETLIIAKEIEHKYIEEQAYAKLGVAFYRSKDFPRAEKFFESSIKLFEDMRFLLQEKDEWKISFRDKRDSYSFFMDCSITTRQDHRGAFNSRAGSSPSSHRSHEITIRHKINSINIKRANGKDN